MTIFGKATNDIELVIQFSLTNAVNKMISVYGENQTAGGDLSLTNNTVNNINVFRGVIKYPPRFVRIANFSGSQINALTLYYQLSN